MWESIPIIEREVVETSDLSELPSREVCERS